MGGGSWYRAGMTGPKEFHKVGEIDGVKVIQRIKIVNPHDKRSFDVPTYSNTADTMYLAKDKDGNLYQLRLFKNHEVTIDFDWTHDHLSEKGKEDIFRVHVHEWPNHSRNNQGRWLTDEEWNQYVNLLKKIDKRLHK